LAKAISENSQNLGTLGQAFVINKDGRLSLAGRIVKRALVNALV
jgi:hypothetical protein